MKEKQFDLILLRSTYFNDNIGKNIFPQLFYVSLPTSERDLIEAKGNLDDFKMHTYSKMFIQSEEGRIKMESDMEEYLYELDKRTFME